MQAAVHTIQNFGSRINSYTTKGIYMELNQSIVSQHRQLFNASCIPMTVELVLKLHNKIKPTDFTLQQQWQDKTDGNFSDLDGKLIEQVKFKKQFGVTRGNNFPLQDLFECIDKELEAERYVIISLANSFGWHMYVIYDKSLSNDEYSAVSKDIQGNTLLITDVKAQVKKMKGTDILTYTIQVDVI